MENEKSLKTAYEKAADEGIDPRCIPLRLTEAPPVHDQIISPEYSDDDNDTWSKLYNRQLALLEGRVCDEYLEGTRLMGFTQDYIPSLRTLSRVLDAVTGWKVARVPGLIHVENFFDLLRSRIFPSTDYIRGKHEIDYTPAPDLFHDIFGHMPLLTNTSFANFYQKFGEASYNAKGEQQIFLERLHWFTVEFGLIKTAAGLRIYGAGIASSLNEVEHSLSAVPVVHDFDLDKIIAQEYDVWHVQPIYFAIESFEQLEDAFTEWTHRQGLLK